MMAVKSCLVSPLVAAISSCICTPLYYASVCVAGLFSGILTMTIEDVEGVHNHDRRTAGASNAIDVDSYLTQIQPSRSSQTPCTASRTMSRIESRSLEGNAQSGVGLVHMTRAGTDREHRMSPRLMHQITPLRSSTSIIRIDCSLHSPL